MTPAIDRQARMLAAVEGLFPPGRMSTLAGFLGDLEPLPTLTPIATKVRRLNPDAWPDADAIREMQGDEGC